MSNDKNAPFEAFPFEPGLYSINVSLKDRVLTGRIRLNVDLEADPEDSICTIVGKLDDNSAIRGGQKRDGVFTIKRQHRDGKETVYQVSQISNNSYRGASTQGYEHPQAVSVEIGPREKDKDTAGVRSLDSEIAEFYSRLP